MNLVSSQPTAGIDGWILNEIARKKSGKIIEHPDNPIMDELECSRQTVCQLVMCFLRKCESYQRLFTISFGQSSKEFSEYRTCTLDTDGIANFLQYAGRRVRFRWEIRGEITANELIQFKNDLEKVCTEVLRGLDASILKHFQKDSAQQMSMSER